MFFKIANSDLVISAENEIAPEKALSSPEITERFKKLAHTIKRVSPRSDEFVYFIARGIHAMEHSAIDPVTRTYNSKLGHIAKNDGQGNCLTCGTALLKTARGEPISGLWCEASEVEPWINQNGDAFPEEELLMEIKDPRDSSKTIKAYQTFVGKGLFTDHKSSEVENIRGIILDAEYDHSTKGVDLLIALDKVNYPELARQVTAGYSQSVSMGCFKAGTMITMSDYTLKPIENIEVGDQVLTHTGSIKKVYKTFRRMHQGTIYDVDVYGSLGLLTATEEHPFYVVDRNLEYLEDARISDFSWREVKDLTGKEYGVKVIPNEPFSEDVSSDFALLAGIYAAEGVVKYKKNKSFEGFALSISVEEKEFRDEIIAVIEKNSSYRIVERKSKHGKALEIVVCDSKLAEKLYEYVGANSLEKKLSKKIFGWSLENKKAFLRGYIKGDGCFANYNKKSKTRTGRLQASTANLSLANQIASLALICGIPSKISSFSRTKKYNGEKGRGFTTEHTTTFASTYAYILNDGSYKVAKLNKTINPGPQYKKLLNRYFSTKIRGIVKRDNYNDYVYNFSVEDDDSYIANGVVVHNCGVSYSLCSLCGNKAVTEMDYCNHVRAGKGLSRAGEKRCYEINNGLSFIELSMVGNGADPRAKIRTIIAQANEVKKNLEANIKSHPDNSENPLILSSISRLESQILDLQENLEKVAEQSKFQEQSFTSEILNKIGNLENQIKEIGGRFMTQKNQEKKAYMQGTEEPTPGKPFQMSDKDYHDYWESDKHLHGKGMDEGKDGLHSGYGLGSDEEVKKMYQRASVEERKQIRKALMDKLAYMQGTEEPTPGKPFEMSDKPYKQYWESDKTMVGKGMEPGKEGLHPGYGMGSDEEVKKELLRAKLRAKLEKAANPAKNRWTVFAGETPVLTLTAEEAYNDSLNDVAGEIDESTTNQEWFDSRNYGINLIQAIKTLGLEKVASQIQKAKTVVAQAAPEAAAPEVMEAPAPAAEEAPAEESQVAESIKAAAERIESAKDEILALTEELTGEEAEAGAELAGDLGAAQAELGELGAEMATPMPAATAKTYNRLVRYALANAEQALENAEAFVESILDTEEAALEVTAAKKKLPEALRKHLEKKKKKDKKAMTEEEINLRKEARHAIAQKLYNLTDGDMIAEAHPEGGNTTTFPGNPEGKIETVKEQQEKDIEVAESMPRGELVARRQTREKLLFAAEKLAQHPAEEAAKKAKDAADAAKKAADAAKAQPVKPAQASSEAVKTAEVDKETKQYYKELASESATGQKPDAEVSKFYNELTQDFGKKKSTAAVHDFALKMKRAYAVSLKRASLGQIESSNEAIEADVDRLVQLDDQSFQALAEVVENTKKVRAELAQAPKQVRTAGALNVGINEAPEMSFTDQLNKLPWR